MTAARSGIGAPATVLPAGACDTHMHVFGPARLYLAAPDARYALPDAMPEDYAGLARRLGVARAVLVQPSFYGTDNRCLLHALRKLGPWTRGVVMASSATRREELASWHVLGVRGIRIDLFKARAQGQSGREMRALVTSTAERAADLGWSLDLYTPGPMAFDLAPLLVDLPTPCSIAHLGFLKADEGLTDRQCEAFVDTVREGNVWIKLTGAYRYGAGSSRATMLAALFLQVMPTHVIWGTDWPHVMAPPQDTTECFQWVSDLVVDDATRRLVFADNAAGLYGFAPGEVSGTSHNFI